MVLLLLLSCGKKKERVLHLKAINPATGQVYPGLSWRVTATISAGSGEKKVYDEEGILDANGEATLTVKLKNSWTYNIRVIEPENTCYNKQITMHITEPEKKEQEFLFEFAPCAGVGLNIKNINCGGPDDVIKFRIRNSYSNFEGFSTERYGCYEFNDGTYPNRPAGWLIYNWVVTKNNNVSSFTDSIFVAPNDTSTIVMHY